MFSPMSRAAALVALGVLAACAHEAPSVHAIAARYALAEDTVTTPDGFRHLVMAAGGDAAGPVRVYIEGDGLPWLGEYVPAPDPSPRRLVALEMMAAGERPALYVGRPCYFGGVVDPGCEPVLWTHARFGPRVQRTMTDAIAIALERRGWAGRPLVLIGFSGGGTLATLLATSVARVCAVVTVASPLDIDEWADARGYSRLAGSDNPALRPPLPPSIAQLHLRGERDRVVAADNGARFFAANPGAERRVIPGAGHGDEWSAIWPPIDRRSLPLIRCGRGDGEAGAASP